MQRLVTNLALYYYFRFLLLSFSSSLPMLSILKATQFRTRFLVSPRGAGRPVWQRSCCRPSDAASGPGRLLDLNEDNVTAVTAGGFAMVFGKPLEKVTFADIEALVESGRPEGRLVEYKQELPKRTDGAKKEFLADVSSFANASGGIILYGIEEESKGGKKTGIPKAVVGVETTSFDAVRLWMEQVVRGGVEPRINGILIHTTDVPSGKPTVAIQIPDSLNAPHMVTFGNTSRFFSRSQSGKYQLDVQQIRDAFLVSESITERVRDFRLDRISRILAEETPALVSSDSLLTIHFAPLSAQHIDRSEKFSDVRSEVLSPICTMKRGGGSTRFNLDGILFFEESVGEAAPASYAQLFRDGSVEIVDVWALSSTQKKAERRISTGHVEERMLECMEAYVNLMGALEVAPPFACMVSLLRVQGSRLKLYEHSPMPVRHGIDRNNVLLPDVVVHELPVEADKVLRDAMDDLWRAGGYSRCQHFDENGNWVRDM